MVLVSITSFTGLSLRLASGFVSSFCRLKTIRTNLHVVSFATAQSTNVSIVYIIDSYRPIPDETVVTQLVFKCKFDIFLPALVRRNLRTYLAYFGFLLSFYTNPWIASSGYSRAFGAMAGISATVLAMWVPFYLWGNQWRYTSLRWRLMTHTIGWSADREVGE